MRYIGVLVSDGVHAFKTKHLSVDTYLGSAHNIVRLWSLQNIQEIIVIRLESRPWNNQDFVNFSNLAKQSFVPIGIAGNCSDFDIASRMFSIGFEKVGFDRTKAKGKIELINEVGCVYGRQAIFDICPFTSISQFEKEVDCKMETGESVFVDVSSQGTFRGPNLEILEKLHNTNYANVYCGGVNNRWLNDYNTEVKNLTSIGVSSILSVDERCNNAIPYVPEKLRVNNEHFRVSKMFA